MRKYIILFLLLSSLFLTSCGRNIKDTESIQGHTSFEGEKEEILSLDYFTSIDRKYSMDDDNLPRVTQNVFNLDNITKDLEDKKIDSNLFITWSINKTEYSAKTTQDGIKTIRAREAKTFLSNTYTDTDAFRNLVLSNPERYYSSEFLKNVKKLEEGSLTKEVFLQTYGLYYVYNINKYQSSKRTITISDINHRENSNEINLLFSYFEFGEKSLSLEEYSKAMKLIELYDIHISLKTSGASYGIEEYMKEMNSCSSITGEITNQVTGSTVLFLPMEYKIAADILGIIAY